MAPTDITRHPGGLVNPLILGLIICQLLASTSAISEDVYRRLINPDGSQARLLDLHWRKASWAGMLNAFSLWKPGPHDPDMEISAKDAAES